MNSCFDQFGYLKYKDGKVELSEEYLSNEKEVVFYELDEQAKEDLRNGNYEPYLNK